MIEWNEVNDEETDNQIIGGHSVIGEEDVMYPIPRTDEQSAGMRALIEYAISENCQDGQGWIKGYSMDPPRPCRAHLKLPEHWFPVTLEFLDGDGDKCRVQCEFFLEQDKYVNMTAFRVSALVDHDGYSEAVSLAHLHEHLCHYFGTQLPVGEEGDRDGDDGEIDWA